jgi:hypothetical protein
MVKRHMSALLAKPPKATWIIKLRSASLQPWIASLI